MVVLDTSAIVRFAVAALGRRSQFPRKLMLEIDRRWPNAQLLVHPVTLAELATNSHEEVQQAKLPPRDAAESQLVAAANRAALLTLGGRAGDVHLDALPFLPSWDDWSDVVDQRTDFRNLRCTRKSGVVPVTAMVDHLILAAADAMARSGHPAALVSGDLEQLGAAWHLGVEVLYTRDFTRADFAWKDCQKDESCVRGCHDGVAACDVMFGGPENRTR